MESKQKRILGNLFASGTALIAFVILEAVKLVLYLILDPLPLQVLNLIFANNESAAWILIGLVVGITLLEILVGCFIGFSARSEAKGKKRNIFYVIVAIIFATLVCVSAVFTLIESFLDAPTVSSIFDAVVSALLSAVVVYALVDVVVCSLKNRKINKENKNKDKEVQA